MSPKNSAIQRTSSLQFLSTARPAATQKKKWPPEDEVIPDSEEERIREERGDGYLTTEDESDMAEISSSPGKRPRIAEPSVIVISSDSDGEAAQPKSQGKNLPASHSEDPFLESGGSKQTTLQLTPALHPNTKGKHKARKPMVRVESENDSVIICVSDTGSEPPPPSASPIKQRIAERKLTPYEPILAPSDPDINSDDSAILTFDPHVHAKPIPRTPVAEKTSNKKSVRAHDTANTPTVSKSPKKRKAISAEQLRLEAYARTLFHELNEVVFQRGIDAELVWNARLLTSAGRAFWHRDSDGQTSAKIELSPKVVDCDERVRNTLAHELCHLAVWILDGNPKAQGHGREFKAWSSRVTKARPDIIINTKHTYDINYKFQWECVGCGKVYGRHSDSIDIEKQACGVCDPPGLLKPLFQKRKRGTPKTAGGSKLASGSPRESPRSLDRAPRSPAKSAKPKSKLGAKVPRRPGLDSDLTDEEQAVEDLIKGLASVGI